MERLATSFNDLVMVLEYVVFGERLFARLVPSAYEWQFAIALEVKQG